MTLETTTKEKRSQERAAQAAIKATAARFGVTIGQMLGRSRSYPIARARHVAIFAAREVGGASYPDLARAFNRGNHGTAINSCEVVRSDVQIYPDFKASVEAVLSAVRLAIEEGAS